MSLILEERKKGRKDRWKRKLEDIGREFTSSK